MGDKNHLHVCRHCGVVHATATTTPPRECIVCAAITFSQYQPEATQTERRRRETPLTQ